MSLSKRFFSLSEGSSQLPVSLYVALVKRSISSPTNRSPTNKEAATGGAKPANMATNGNVLLNGNVLAPINENDGRNKFSLEKGFFVDAQVESLVVDDWLGVWDAIEQNAKRYPKSSTTQNPIKKIKLATDHIIYGDQNFKDVTSQIEYDADVWYFQLDAPVAKGVLQYKPGSPLKIVLDYFH